MKKFNYNIISFGIVSLLIIGSWFSISFLEGIKDAVEDYIQNPSFTEFIHDIDEASKQLSYKGILLNVHSYTEYVKGTRSVEKDDYTVVRLDNDYLSFATDGLDTDTLITMADKTLELQAVVSELEIPLLYVMAPTKAYFDCYPSNQTNMFKKSYDEYSELLNERGIEVLHLGEKMMEQKIGMEEAYFITDHHWLPETGLWAANEICSYLKEHHEFEYDVSLLQKENYSISVYKDCFLGSQGKKVGKYFTPLGLDDFSVIIPKFENSFSVNDKKGNRVGKMENTLIQMSYLDEKDIYYSNPYLVYTGGDFPLQVIENQLMLNEGKKILVIRDSYAGVVTPFLSMTTESLHTIDVRHWNGIEGANTIVDYIRVEKPDYILILYSDLIPTLLNFY